MDRRRPARRRAPLLVLLLCAPLVLSTSQVGSDPMPASADAPLAGGVCEAAAPVDSLTVNERIAELALAEALPQGNPDVVVLNGRGYNYGPPPDRELETLRVEMLREQARERAR